MTLTSRSRRASAALAAIVVVLGLAAPVSWAARRSAVERQENAEAARGEAEATEAEASTRLAELQASLRTVQRDHSLAERQRRAVANAATVTGADQHQTSEEVAATQQVLTEKSTTLGSSQSFADAQRQGANDLDGCVRAVMDAVGLLNGDKRKEGVDRLQGVVDTCRRAESYLTAGQHSPDFPWDFADPFVLGHDGVFTAYATNAIGGHIQAIRSSDLTHWQWLGEALPLLPGWADPGRTWAPSVIKVGDRYALYYTARHKAQDRQCISVAFAPKPEGPFVDTSTEPLVCQHELNGSIDASPFVDLDGTPYLLWKSEGETVGKGRGVARLWSAPLTPDGSRLAFVGTEILRADRDDEMRTVEGPSLIWTLEGYFLIYSTNKFDGRDYRVDFATCAGPSGPCTKPPGNRLLSSFANITGPGGAEWFRAQDGSPMVSYHAWVADEVGFPYRRILHINKIAIRDGRPVVG